MPTAAKLISALFFAAISWFAADRFAVVLPESTPIGSLPEVSTFFGAVLAWSWMGRRSGRSYSESLGNGIVTSALIFLSTNLFFSIVLMFKRTMDMRYRDAVEAVFGVFDLMMQHGTLLVSSKAAVILLVGGAVGGLCAEFAARRWS
jgi:hypothetical protein